MFAARSWILNQAPDLIRGKFRMTGLTVIVRIGGEYTNFNMHGMTTRTRASNLRRN